MLNRKLRTLAALLTVLFLLAAGRSEAQTARISGFVTDRSNGRALHGATVALYRTGNGRSSTPGYGTSTDEEGIFIIGGIDAGRYELRVSFVGYEVYRDDVDVAAGDVTTANVALAATYETLREVVVEGGGAPEAADIESGHQRIRPEEIRLIPTPDLSADLGAYLTVLPGVVTVGDRGGQLFVRGGEPSQNLAMLDGMVIYQPFHVLGPFSAFPAEIIDHVDFYSGGFGASYSGRLSSVLDVSSRSGNKRQFGGAAGISPVMGAVHVEGPITRDRASFLVSVRSSVIRRVGEPIYGRDMPFQYSDAFARAETMLGLRNRLSASAVRSYDRGNLVPEVGSNDPEEVWWENRGFAVNWLILPRAVPVVANLSVSQSAHVMEQGTRSDTVRTTRIRDTRVALDATFAEGAFFAGRITTNAGWEALLGRTENDFGGIFQNYEHAGVGIPRFGLYVEPTVQLGDDVKVKGGLRLQKYNVRFRPYLEPRLRTTWRLGSRRLNVAIGLHHQQVVGLVDQRDAASVYTAWTGISKVSERPPRLADFRQIGPFTYSLSEVMNYPLYRLGGDLLRGRLGRAVHVLAGYQSTPASWLAYSIEGFFKNMSNLFVAELSPYPGASTRLMPATGRTIGFDVRLEFELPRAYALVTYALSNTTYSADGRVISDGFGLDRLTYHPQHDRRHQISALISTTVGRFQASLRWHFGSGTPYTEPIGFDRFVLVSDIRNANEFNHSLRVIFERPFGAILPTYHRLDFSVKRTFDLSSATLTLQASVQNVYDRRNIFYLDVFTLRRADQLPIMPFLGIQMAFK